MGTRGAYGFRLGDKDYVFYNHFDSYPDGLGADVVKFLEHEIGEIEYDEGIGLLKQRVRSMEAIDEKIPPTDIQKKFLESYADLSVSRQTLDDWYCLLRNTQGDIELTLSARYFSPADKFLMDGLFCEYAYIVNLDTEMLEFYEGFKEYGVDELTGRYALQEKVKKGESIADSYAPVCLIREFPLSEIGKTDFVKEMIEAIEKDEDDD